MFEAARPVPVSISGPRPLPVACSLAVHAALFGLLAFAPHGNSGKQLSLYEQVVKPYERKLVWYSFRKKLPDVAPVRNQNPQPHAAALEPRDQTIVSNPKSEERGAQMMWRPAPRIKPQPEISSPNILAFRLPAIEPPPPGPPKKLFVPPWRAPKEPPSREIALPEPPDMRPVVETRQSPALQAALAAPLVNRPKPRAFIPPIPRRERPPAGARLPEVPRLATSPPPSNPPLAETLAALAKKPALKPPGGVPGSEGAAPVLPVEEAPTSDAAAMPSMNVNAAVVGLNPAEKLLGPLPETSRDARFSAGPDTTGDAEGEASPSGPALSVPGLLVSGGTTQPRNSDAVNPLMARVAPTSPESLEAAVKGAGVTDASDPPSAELHLSPPPGEQFAGRDVYTLAVQMPNITSHLGSWIMWFAERSPAGPRRRHDLTPPVPIHKVDPKYYPALIAERISGKVYLVCIIGTDGRVSGVHLLKGLHPQLNHSAARALLKWQFQPAQRNGAPVAVDMVAEIPFLLAPQVTR